ncbi:transporter substrate-binding domain-containing protein [Meiothermus sp. CFH 77666]|uniref:transporter substrate-binding domain-containing protein n=1 Tax=Meiothermus sp. CFH 77666 TaxID=2817942 RepID=UPI001AA03AAA|nr:transporter substrate-binding domain-containing protein [Meiothermus sp. CFH 77666]MBO1436571.1 transporter substrate-binding domain-containing protein [Meiothermus sp. CFH 77666]
MRALGWAVLFGLAWAQPQEYPFPNRFLKTDRALTFCLDKQNPLWPLEERVAQELARTLGRPARFYIHREAQTNLSAPPIPVTRREFQVLLARYCDVYMGLLGSTTAAFDYPADEQMLATRPYYRSRYVLVSRQADGLNQVPKNEPIGIVGRSLPYNLILRQFPGRYNLAPVINSAVLARKLLSGEFKHGVIFAPALYALERNPAQKGLKVGSLEGLPNTDWYVIAAVARDRVTLRDQLDRAIERLLKSGRMARLIQQENLPTAFFTPTAPNEQRPQSESDRDGR